MKCNRDYVGHQEPKEREACWEQAHLRHKFHRAIEDLGTAI